MADITAELLVKFQQFWRAGNRARLNLECCNGQAWVNLHVQLPEAPPPPHHQAAQRRQGPSRTRRRARRAEMRKIAAEVQAAESSDTTDIAAAQADTVQSTVAAEEAATVAISPLSIPAEKADQEQHEEEHSPPPVLSAQEEPEEGVADVFCPDDVYQTAAQAEPECENIGKHGRTNSKQTSGITLEDFQRLAAESSRMLRQNRLKN